MSRDESSARPNDWSLRYGPAAVVTGASSGIGKAFARRLARRGLDLVLVARRRESLEDLAAELATTHRIDAHAVVQDLSQRNGAERVVAAVDELGLEIGLLVSNAGFGTYGPFVDQEPETEVRIVEVNCRTPVALASAFAPRMVERGRGGMIFLASTGAFQPVPFLSVYAATKAFNLMLAESLWSELAPQGVDVIALAPGFILTGFQETAGMGEQKPITGWMAPEDAVEACLQRLGRDPSVIPGFRNWLVASTLHRMPRKIAAAISYRFNKPPEAKGEG